MKKISEFVKKYFWVLILVIIIVAVIGDALLQKATQNPASTPTPVPQTASFNSIVPGASTEADLNKVLGTPLKTTINGLQTTDEYAADNTLRNHIAIIESGKVAFIKQIVSATDTTTASSITSVYGQAPNILYGTSPNSPFNLYVYPANGIAYLGHADGTLLEIWYFVPTTIDNFLTTWGAGYSTTPSTEEVQ